jgi:transcriptional regulator with XRE-family HTH domain
MEPVRIGLWKRLSAGRTTRRPTFGQLAQRAAQCVGDALKHVEPRRGLAVFDAKDSFCTSADGYGQLLDAHSTGGASLSNPSAYIHEGSLLGPVYEGNPYEVVARFRPVYDDARMPSSFAERIREIITTLGLDQSQFAEFVGVGDKQIYRWMKGEQSPSMETLLKIADVADCSIEWLMTGEGKSGLVSPEVPGIWAAAVRGYRKSSFAHGMRNEVYNQLLRLPYTSKRRPTSEKIHEKRTEIEASMSAPRGASRVERESSYPVLNALMERMKWSPAVREHLLSVANSQGDLSEAGWLRLAERTEPKKATPKIRRKA